MLSPQQFTAQLVELQDQYRRENAWVNNWAHWDDDAIMADFITYAYNLYAATATNRLKLTLLGGTEIRKNAELIQNFGVTGVNGIQDRATKELVHEEIRRRRALRRPPPNPQRNRRSPYVSVTRSGSILSEKGWTPILNDALIIGAVTAGQGFGLALTPLEMADWETLNKEIEESQAKPKPHMMDGVGVKNKYLADKFGQSKAIWKTFLNSQKQMFLDNKTGFPRVFTREMLGLSFSGYRPEFSSNQLGFSSSGKKPLDFKTYLQDLSRIGFHKGKPSEARIMRAISMFLFGEETAIGSPWSSDTKIDDGVYSDYIH